MRRVMGRLGDHRPSKSLSIRISRLSGDRETVTKGRQFEKFNYSKEMFDFLEHNTPAALGGASNNGSRAL